MGIVTRALERRAGFVFNPLHPRDPGLAQLFGLSGRTNAGSMVTPDTAMESPTMLSIYRYLTETIAASPLVLFERIDEDENREAFEVPLYNRLRTEPNRYQTAFEWLEMSQGHVFLRGNAYSELVPSREFPPFELMPLHPDRVWPFWAPGGQIAYAYRPSSGPERVLLKEEMFHVRFMPDDGLRGKSVIFYGRELIGSALSTERYGASFFENDARPGGYLKHPGTLSEEAQQRLLNAWEDRHKGGGNNSRSAVLEEGMTWEQVTVSPEDAQFLQTRKELRRDQAGIGRVQPHKIGDLERATFSNIEHQSLEAVNDTIFPWAERWQQAVYARLLTAEQKSRYFARFDLERLLRGDQAAEATALSTMRQNGVINADEWRRRKGMNPIKDGSGKMYYMPLNMIPAAHAAESGAPGADGTAAALDAQVQALALNGAQIASLLEIVQSVATGALTPSAATLLIQVAFPSLTEDEVSKLVAAAGKIDPTKLKAPPQQQRSLVERRSRLGVERLRTAYAPAFEDAAKRVLRREAQEVGKHFRQMAQTASSRSVAEFSDWVTDFYGTHQEVVRTQMAPVVDSYAAAMRDLAADIVGADPTALDIAPFAQSYTNAYAVRHISQSRAQVQELIGGDPDELAPALKDLLDTWEVDRAGHVARNEVVKAGSAVQRQTWRLAGITKIEWNASANACGLCLSLDGQVVGIEREFASVGETIDGDEGQAPLEASKTLHPPLHKGCDCSISPA